MGGFLLHTYFCRLTIGAFSANFGTVFPISSIDSSKGFVVVVPTCIVWSEHSNKEAASRSLIKAIESGFKDAVILRRTKTRWRVYKGLTALTRRSAATKRPNKAQGLVPLWIIAFCLFGFSGCLCHARGGCSFWSAPFLLRHPARVSRARFLDVKRGIGAAVTQ